MGLRQLLADATSEPDDAIDPAWMDVERWLQKHYVTSAREKARRNAARQRRLLFDCGGLDMALQLIDEVFKDVDVRRLRKELAPYARFDNALRRITLERARVYAKPAKVRRVAGETDYTRYRELQRRTMHDFAMRQANHLVTLQNDAFILFRVRQTPRGLQPRTDVIGPESFHVVADKRDPTKLIAVIIDRTPAVPTVDAAPHFLVWTDSEVMELDRKGRILRDSIAVNPFGRIPGVLVNGAYRDATLLDPLTGEDAVAAHLAAWLINTMMLKEVKSLNRQAAFLGETGASPTGQAQDSERDMQLAPGVGVTTIDRGVDIEKFLLAADHVIERAAANHGIPPSVLRHAGATSGYEMDLRRIPLEELREDQIVIFREAERELADVQAMVLARDMPELAFSTDGWWIDFAEVKRPMPEKEKYETRKLKRSMGHSDPVVEALEDNPDFTEDMAIDWVMNRLQAYSMFVQSIRALNMPMDATVEDAGASPDANGRANQPGDDPQAQAADAPPASDEQPASDAGAGEGAKFFQYEIEGGLVTINEVRKSKGLPPFPDGHLTLPELRVAKQELYAGATLTQAATSAEKIVGLADADEPPTP
jgi:hypothetical protein